jgi:hypothetical protein
MLLQATPTSGGDALTRRRVITGGVIAIAGVATRSLPVLADASDEVSHTAEGAPYTKSQAFTPKTFMSTQESPL